MTEREPIPSPRPAEARDWACIAVAMAIGAIVYQPWAANSLPLADFGTVLPLIDRSEGPLRQLWSVTSFHAGEGRLCLFPYLLFVVGANAFGTWAPGWHLTYFALNAVVISLFWFVLRRMGLARTAAFLATVLWIPMTATTELWLRPTGEPFALAFFLSALLLAIGYAESHHWRRRAFLIAVLCVGVLYSKEILIVLLPAGWVVSRLSRNDSEPRWRPWGRQDSFLLWVVGAAVALALIPIAWIAATAQDGSYASGFGETGAAGRVIWDRIGMVFLPTRPELASLRKVTSDPWWFILLALPNLVWLRLLAGGMWKGRRKLVWPLAISLLWAGLGVLAYSAWTDPQTFYMAPFALGAMFGAAHVVGCLVSGSRPAAAAAIALGSALVVISAVEANSRMLRHRLRADLNGGVIARIAESGSVRAIGAAVPAAPRDQRWGWARHVEGFIVFSGGARPAHSGDYSCEAARKALESDPGMLVVSRDRGCGRLTEASAPIDKSTTRAQWPYFWQRHKVSDRMYISRSGPQIMSLQH